MASKNFESRTGYMQVKAGEDKDGAPIYKNKTIGKLEQNVDGDQLITVMSAIGDVLAVPEKGTRNARAVYTIY